MNYIDKNLLIKLQEQFNKGLYIKIEQTLSNRLEILNNEQIIMLYGLSLLKLKKFNLAEIQFRKLIDLNEKNIEAYFQLGISLRAQKKNTLAINVLKKSLLFGKNKVILLLLANLYRDIGSLNDALNTINYCIKKFPNFTESYFALANINADLGKLDDAKNSIMKFVNQNNVQALISYSYILLEEGDYKLAEKVLRKLLEININNNFSKFNLAIVMLIKMEFQTGWQLYESRFALNNYYSSKKILDSLSKPRWNLKMPKTKILIWGEQGIGDQVLFSYFIDEIYDNFEKITLCVNEKLIPFLQPFYPKLTLKSLKDIYSYTDFDYHIPMSSLGLYFHHNNKQIKNINFYFNHKNIPKKNQKIRCGISWASNSGVTSSKKSIDFDLFSNIFLISNIEFINLQYTDELKAIEKLEKKINKKIFLDHNVDCFNNIFELAGLMQSCDLIITVSNSNAHLAGKLGIKTFLLLPKHAGKYWYWHNIIDANKSYWYPSIEIINQGEDLLWKNVLDVLYKKLIKFS